MFFSEAPARETLRLALIFIPYGFSHQLCVHVQLQLRLYVQMYVHTAFVFVLILTLVRWYPRL